VKKGGRRDQHCNNNRERLEVKQRGAELKMNEANENEAPVIFQFSKQRKGNPEMPGRIWNEIEAPGNSNI
jgi:hypothetical protein